MRTWEGKDNRSYTSKRRHPYPGSKGHQALHAVVSMPKCIIIIRHLRHIRMMLNPCAQELDASIHRVDRSRWVHRTYGLFYTATHSAHVDRIVMSRPQPDRRPWRKWHLLQAQRDGLITKASRSYTLTPHGCHDATTL